jgi:hypothetical protein
MKLPARAPPHSCNKQDRPFTVLNVHRASAEMLFPAQRGADPASSRGQCGRGL